MKRKHLCLSLGALTAAAAGLFLALSLHAGSPLETRKLDALTDTFFENELRASTLNLHYTLADPKAYGITDYPILLGDLSEQSLRDGQMLLENYQASLRDIRPHALSETDRLTYDVLAHTLRTAEEGYSWYYYQEPLSPSLGVQAQLPILLAEYAFYSEKDVQDYLGLLAQTDDYFSSILAFEREKARRSLFMSDAAADGIIAQCRTFIEDSENSYLEELFAEKLQKLPRLNPIVRDTYLEEHALLMETSVRPAYEQLAEGLASLKGSGVNDCGLCYFPKGAEYYEYLVQSTVGTEKSVEQLERLLAGKRSGYSNAIASLLAENPSLLASLDLSSSENRPDAILNSLKQRISGDFPALPKTSCTVKEVHPSLQEHSSPAFYLTPPMDRMADNVIYINPANGYQGIELFTTLAHEGYPGHLYQTVFSHANCENPLQSILGPGGYTEGWATYAEMYSYGLAGLEEDAARLLMLNKAWSLNLYSAIDIGVHYYGWTAYDVYEFLNGYGIGSLSAAEEIFHAVIENPANYLKYYVGYLEFDALRERAAHALGNNFDLKDYHEYLLTLGPAPFPLLEEKIDAYIARKD